VCNLAGIWIEAFSGMVLVRPAGVAAAGRLFEPIAVAIHGQNADVVREPIEQCISQTSDPRTCVHSSNSRLEVMIVEPHSQRCEKVLNRSSVPILSCEQNACYDGRKIAFLLL